MTTPNHIAGGIAITGISLSFYDINIFSEASFLAVCVFGSILPDIDHTKSIIGKFVFPIARYLDRNFGHRTITHSLTFFIPIIIISIFLELNFINPYFERSGLTYSMIFGLSIFSHFILDMSTIAGIPLFWPLMKNPCVFPANPNFRLRSGNLKSESLALAFFLIVIFSSVDLFQNGFWTSYNRGFGTIMHVNREFQRQSNLLAIEYSFDLNGVPKKGKAYLLNATEFELELFENDKIWTLSGEDNRIRNIDVKPVATKFIYQIHTIPFSFYSEEQLNDTLSGKVISGEISSNGQFFLNGKLVKNSITFHKVLNPEIKSLKKSFLALESDQKVAILEAKLNDLRKDNSKKINKLQNLEKELQKAENELEKDLSIYELNKFENLRLKSASEIANFNLEIKPTSEIEIEISNLKKSEIFEEKIYFSGLLQVYILPKNDILEDNFQQKRRVAKK